MALAYNQVRAVLYGMRQARRATAHQLDCVCRRILAEAQARTVSERGKLRQFGRHATTWTPADERHYQLLLLALQGERAAELTALQRKLARQDAALAAFVSRHGVNDLEEAA